MKKIPGKLTIFIGKMYDGKTEELLAQANISEKYVGKRIFYFKPKADTRDTGNIISSHNGRKRKVIIVSSSQEILPQLKSSRPKETLVLIDELQFFDHRIIAEINNLIHLGFDVMTAGLATDYLARPFGATLILAGYADKVEFLKNSRCTYKNKKTKRTCGKIAIFNQRIDEWGKPVTKITKIGIIDVGAKDKYGPRCRKHWVWPKKSWDWTKNIRSLYKC